MSSIATFLRNFDNIYYGALGIDSKSGIGPEYWKYKETHPNSISSELDKKDGKISSREKGGKNRARGEVLVKPTRPKLVRRAAILNKVQNRDRDSIEVSRRNRVMLWIDDMEKDGWYARGKLSAILGVSESRIVYAMEKGRIPISMMKCGSSAHPVRMARLEDAQKWLEIDKQMEDGNRPNLPEWQTMYNKKHCNKGE